MIHEFGSVLQPLASNSSGVFHMQPSSLVHLGDSIPSCSVTAASERGRSPHDTIGGYQDAPVVLNASRSSPVFRLCASSQSPSTSSPTLSLPHRAMPEIAQDLGSEDPETARLGTLPLTRQFSVLTIPYLQIVFVFKMLRHVFLILTCVAWIEFAIHFSPQIEV
jgi:hypothetical protein